MQGNLIQAIQADENEAARILSICNACRYCEGFCAMFPAMTRRLDFTKADVHYLANLCHNCGACLHSCQYAPPHEFAVNIPRTMAKLRRATYEEYAWPKPIARIYRNNGTWLTLVLVVMTTLFLALTAIGSQGLFWKPSTAGNFYEAFSHSALVSMFLPVFAFVVIAMMMGIFNFLRASPLPARSNLDAQLETMHSIASLKYLDGGHGEGCNEESDRFTKQRRFYHHLTFYGFLLCFASTSIATLYHYLLDYQAPYPFFSVPVLLGTFGGIGLCWGGFGLLRLRLGRHPLHIENELQGMDVAFILQLFLLGLTGLALLALRDTQFMPLTLAIHLGCVMAFFLCMPYSKFMHGIYRGVALFKWAIEKRLPNRLGLSE